MNKINITKTKKIAFIGILVCQAIVLNIFERLIPVNLGVPGAKIGLANIVTLTALYFFNFKDILIIVVLRTLLGSFFAGSLSSFMYSFAGALFSFFVMYFILQKFKEEVSPVALSVAGGVSHNIAQLSVASMVVNNAGVFYYLPFLLLTGIATGVFVGATSKFLIKYLNKQQIL